MNTIVKKTFQTISFTAIAALLSLGTAHAQADTEITDEDIKNYIIVMDSIDVLSSELSADISTMIKEHEGLDGGRAYQKIQAAKGDTVLLAEEGITAEQIEAYNEILEELETRKAELNQTFSTLVKEKVGAAEYNRIKKELKKDQEFKDRYEEIAAEREEEKTAEGVEADGGENVN